MTAFYREQDYEEIDNATEVDFAYLSQTDLLRIEAEIRYCQEPATKMAGVLGS